ncbi:hypothetical protein IDVR_28350 [Intrasporangium sp. DVR]
MHGREGTGGRQAVEQDGAAEAAGHREDDGQEDDEAGVEEDREAEGERCDAEREGCPLLPEPRDQGVGEDLGAAGDLEEASEHDAEGDEQRHRPQRAAETAEQRLGDVGDRDPGGDGGEDADEDERHERVQLDLHDEEEQGCDGRGGDQQENADAVGRLDRVHRGSVSRWGVMSLTVPAGAWASRDDTDEWDGAKGEGARTGERLRSSNAEPAVGTS